MGEVKILVYTNPHELERQIGAWMDRDYALQGSVTVGINSVGNIVYVGTMVKKPTKGAKK